MIRKRLRFSLLAFALLLSVGVSSVAGFIQPQTVHAATFPNLSWTDYNHISASGGGLTQTETLTSTTPNSIPGISATFTGDFHMAGCVMFMQLVYNPATADTGTFQNPQPVAGQNFCANAGDFTNVSVGIAPFTGRPAPTGGGGRATTITIRLWSAVPAASSPGNIQIQVKDQNGVLDSVNANKQMVGNDAEYEAKFTLQPGDYTACADNASVYNCGGFTAGDYSSPYCSATDANSVLLRALCSNFAVPGQNNKGPSGLGGVYEFGFPNSKSGVNVNVNFHLSGSGHDDQSFGPLQVTLARPDGTILDTIATTSWSYKGNPLVAATSTQIFAGTVTGTFANVAVGTYKVCILSTAFCDNNVQKFTNAPGNATINLDTTQTAQLAGSLGSDQSPPCERNGDVLTWALCPIFNGLTSLADAILNNIIQPLLQNNLVGLNANDSDFKIWSAFRIYGDIFLIIALIVVVMGQSIGGGLLEAYTVRKVLPRILMATILINLSIYIVAFAVDIANIVGAGVGNLIIAPVKASAEFSFTPNGIQAAGLVAGGVAAAALIGTFLTTALFSTVAVQGAIYIGLFVILPAVLALVGAFITIILLKGLILALIIVSPVAFALYCLPNTEQYFRRWWEWLFRALLVYPIVMTIFAIADVMTVMIQQGNGLCNANTASKGCPPLFEYTIGAGTNIFAVVVAFFVQFLPLVLIPFAFRLAGGIIGKVHDTISGYGKKTHEGILGNPNDPMSLRNRARRNFHESLTRAQAQVVDKGREVNATRAQRARGRISRTLWRGVDERLARYTKEAREREESMSSTGRDALRYAGAGYKISAGEAVPDSVAEGGSIAKDASGAIISGRTASYDRYFDSKGREIGASLYAEGKSMYGKNISDISQGMNYTVRKIQTDQDIANFREAFSRNAAANNWSQTEAMDAWAAATFEYKPQLGSEWYSNPQVQKDTTGRTTGVRYADISNNTTSYKKFIDEQHKTKENYKLGSLRDSEYRAMGNRQNRLETIIDRNGGNATGIDETELQNLAMTGEVIDSQVRQGIQMGMASQDADGNLQVSGVSPAANGVLTAMYKNRKYATRAAKGPGPDGTYSLNQRILYNRQAVEADRQAHLTAGRDPRLFNEEASIAAHTVKRGNKNLVITVTGGEERAPVINAGEGAHYDPGTPTNPNTAPPPVTPYGS
ncbi:MAG TPA: hypothetical protein VJP80_07640 [Candidatus Saccharimonadales bacterium]|nr:hypothetical protein [Candidatus Saccharimonadales bacterium]